MPQVCDFAEARMALDNDDETLQMLIDMVLVELPKQTARIVQALADQDAVTVTNVAHRLKGSLANFRAWSLCEGLLEIEQAARGGNLDGVAGKLALLDPLLLQCLEELRGYRPPRDTNGAG
jgi:HPt (histidine-containing phosphotransfer) domain-containing protein